jgi:hypothetical protein
MKTIALTTVLAALLATPAFAGNDKGGGRCDVRHLTGEWLTAFEYGEDGTGAVACRIAVDRSGKVVRAFCLKDDISTQVPATGAFAVDRSCQITGELTVDTSTFSFSGELADRRDLIVGLVKYGTSFDPVTAVRTGNPSKGKLKNPFDDDDDEDETHLSCSAGDEDVARLEVKFEQSSHHKKGEENQFKAEFEAATGGDLDETTEVTLVIGGSNVATQVLDLDDDELEAEFGFNSRRTPLPDGTPDIVEGTEVGIAVDGTPVLSCTLAAED